MLNVLNNQDSLNARIERNYEQVIKAVKAKNNVKKLESEALIQQRYIELIREHKEFIIRGIEIPFEKDEWDFTKHFVEGKEKINYSYKFGFDCSEEHKIVLKLYVAHFIEEFGIHCSGTKRNFDEVRRFLEFMYEKGLTNIFEVDVEEFKEFYGLIDSYSEHLSCRTIIGRKAMLYKFLKFYILICCDVNLKSDVKEWFEKIDNDGRVAQLERNKTPLLPQKFYKDFKDIVYKRTFDKKADKYSRGCCGLLYIGTQTGMRRSELLILRVQDLKIENYKGKDIGKLCYRATKQGNGTNRVYIEEETLANDKVIKVYKELKKLFREERKRIHTDLLIPKKEKNIKSVEDLVKFSIGKEDIIKEIKYICMEYHKELGVLNLEDTSRFEGYMLCEKNKRITRRMEMFGLKEGDTISYPSVRQFRVYVATERAAMGTPDSQVSHMLGHHTEEMFGYYARNVEIEKPKQIKQIDESSYDAIINRIDKFISDNKSKNKLEIKSDLNELMKDIQGDVPIKIKMNGYCVKPNPARECWNDKKSDDFYKKRLKSKNSNYKLPLTFKKISEAMNIIEYNLEYEYEDTAKQEKEKVIELIENDFEIELKLLNKEISENGKEVVINKYTYMKEFIENLEEKERKVESWKKKVKELLE